MSGKTSIEWTDRTWNPLTGCTKVSPGCDHCYAKTMHERFHGPGSFDTITLHPERLTQPLRWRKPAQVFVNSMSDLFHQDVPDEYIVQVFDAMANAQRHTFEVLTKRHARMRAFVTKYVAGEFGEPELPGVGVLPNVWLGVSVENQQWADIRIPALLETPAAVRFLSCEPLLGPVNLNPWRNPGDLPDPHTPADPRFDWVIVGGESGPGARPMHPDWARALRDQCVAAGVPFLFKQWGEWARPWTTDLPRQAAVHRFDDGQLMIRAGKRRAGRELDGRTWDEYPDGVS